MNSRPIRIAALAAGMLAVAAPSVQAEMSNQDYLQALQLASKKVARQRAAESSAGALSSSMLIQLQGRYYRKGDSWEVAAWQFDQNIMRRMSDPEALKPTVRQGGVFRYEVVEVKPGNAEAVLKVTQLGARGLPVVDPNVEQLTLTFNDKMIQGHKSYRLKDRPEAVETSPRGLRSGAVATRLEMFPLDVPEINTAERLPLPEETRSLAMLPKPIREFADAQGFKVDLAQSVWFEQDDFFGRPVKMLWQKGDPWPAYFKTPQGVAILLRKGGAQ